MATATAPKPEGAGPSLERLKKMFAESIDLTEEARTSSNTCQDYYDGKQLTAGEKLVLSQRGQPDIVINRIKPAINGILGVAERGKADPQAYPREPKDEDSADVATDVLRYIADHNRLHRLKVMAFKDMLVPGSMAAIIEVDADRNVKVSPIRWEELIYDPRARREDFADARYLGVAKWMYVDDVAAQYRDHKDALEGSLDGGFGISESIHDRPRNGAGSWVDKKNRRVMVVELYSRDPSGWLKSCFFVGGILAQGPSPYHDDRGHPTNPIEAQSAYVDRDNNRYGAVRDMVDVQDEINKRRSKLLHHINSRQIQMVDPTGMGVDAETVRSEAARPDGVIPSGWQVVPTSDMAAGQAQLLQESKAEIERMGPNPAILGRGGEDASGRSILARQQSGLVELALLYGGLEDWELRVYRQCWARAKQFWTAPMFIRVTDDENTPRFVGLNQPEHEMEPVVDPATGQPMTHPETGEPAQQPRMYEQPHPETGEPVNLPNVLGYKNSLAEMDIDIRLEATPSTATLQQEQFQDLVQLVGSNPTYAQEVPFKTMLKLSAVPHKRRITDELDEFAKERQAQQAQAQEQQQQAMQMQLQIAQAGGVAKVEETQSRTALNQAKAQQTEAGVRFDAHRLALDTFSAVHPAAGGAFGPSGAPAPAAV